MPVGQVCETQYGNHHNKSPLGEETCLLAFNQPSLINFRAKHVTHRFLALCLPPRLLAGYCNQGN